MAGTQEGIAARDKMTTMFGSVGFKQEVTFGMWDFTNPVTMTELSMLLARVASFLVAIRSRIPSVLDAVPE